jgi:hypothetical protein
MTTAANDNITLHVRLQLQRLKDKLKEKTTRDRLDR